MSRYELDQWVWLLTKGIVQSGPFQGMRYIRTANGSVLAAKLLGTYECELHDWLNKRLREDYQDVVVIGAGEGYYAVGSALRMPGARIHAFDIDAAAQQSIQGLATLNDCRSRIEIGGRCTIESIVEKAPNKTLIICDIEGAERELFAGLESTNLLHCDLLVEVHDAPGEDDILAALQQSFAKSHRLETIEFDPNLRDQASLPASLDSAVRRRAVVEEGRVLGVRWLQIKCRQD